MKDTDIFGSKEKKRFEVTVKTKNQTAKEIIEANHFTDAWNKGLELILLRSDIKRGNIVEINTVILNKERTELIKAYITDERKGVHGLDIHLFGLVHSGVKEPFQSLKNAFKEWSNTRNGSEYILDNGGTNLGDATSIPEDILEKHGINEFFLLSNGMKIEYDTSITVNHDDSLVD